MVASVLLCFCPDTHPRFLSSHPAPESFKIISVLLFWSVLSLFRDTEGHEFGFIGASTYPSVFKENFGEVPAPAYLAKTQV